MQIASSRGLKIFSIRKILGNQKKYFGRVFLTGALVILGTIFESCFFAPKIVRAEPVVVISQVQVTGGTGKTSYDFIELYNTTDNAINLKGYRLVKRSSTGATDTTVKSFTSDLCVPPKGYLLWANSDYTVIAVAPDVTTSQTISNDNGVALRQGDENSGTIIDSIAWGAANNGFAGVSSQNPAANQALLRQDDGTFAIAASNPRNSSQAAPGWICPVTQSGSSSSDTGTGSGVVSKSSEVFITEILANPYGEDAGQEQVEIRNDSLQTVNLDGWFLDDRNGGAVKDNAYKLPPQLLLPQTYLAVTIPKNLFALNNSGGETVNLYNSEKVLMDSAAYEGDAPEGLSFQKIGGIWLWSAPTLGAENYVADYGLATSTPVTIAEFMPNPEGSNEGRQWVRIKNFGPRAFSLQGFMLDNAGTDSRPGTNAWVLDDKAVIPAGGSLVLTIPEDKFTMTNIGHEALRFFDSRAKLLEQINFSQPPEGKSYQKNSNNDWVYGEPLKQKAAPAAPPVKIVISELLPNPADGQKEFVEIQNLEDSEIQLKGMVIKIGDGKKTFNREAAVEPLGYYIFDEDSLPAKLRNSGQTVSISDAAGRELASLEYPAAEAGQAYARSGDGYVWTGEPTPGQENKLVLGAVSAEAETKAPAASSKKASARTPESQILQKLSDLETKIESLKLGSGQNFAAADGQEEVLDNPGTGNGKKIIYLALAAISLVLLALLIKWNLKKP